MGPSSNGSLFDKLARQTNKQDRQSDYTLAFRIRKTEETGQLLNILHDLAAKDGWTLSQLIRTALIEYAQRHYPGNPQLSLGHWSPTPEPLPLTLIENQHEHDWKSLRPGAWVCNLDGCKQGWFELEE